MLKLRHLFSTAVVGLALTPWIAGGPALGGTQTRSYAVVEEWNINYEPDDNRCWMAKTFGRGTTLYLGRINRVWTVAIGNPAWTPRLDSGGKYRISMVLDGYDKWSGSFEARTINEQGEIALYAEGVEVNFLISLMRRNGVQIYIANGEPLTSLPLNNSAAAMLKLADCANAADANGGYRQPAPAAPRGRIAPEFST